MARSLSGVPFSPVLNRKHPLTKGLVSAFVLNRAGGSCRDLVSGQLGTATALTSPTSGFGGVAFNGSTSRMQAASAGSLIQGAYPRTIAALASWTTTATCAICSESDPPNHSSSVTLKINSAATDNCALYVRNVADAEALPNKTVSGLNDGTPHLIVGVSYASNQHYVFVDNYPISGIDGATVSAPEGATSFSAGGWFRDSSVTWPFTGTIFAVWRWNRGLVQSDVLSLWADPYKMFRKSNLITYGKSVTAAASTAHKLTLLGVGG